MHFSTSDDADGDPEESLLTDFLAVPHGDAPLEARGVCRGVSHRPLRHTGWEGGGLPPQCSSQAAEGEEEGRGRGPSWGRLSCVLGGEAGAVCAFSGCKSPLSHFNHLPACIPRRAWTSCVPAPFHTSTTSLQARLDELCRAADRNDLLVHVFQFAPLRSGESLQAHVRRQCLPGHQASPGPTLQVGVCKGRGEGEARGA